MKKAVIKRRKRVSALPGMPFSAIPTTLPGVRLTDQAEALEGEEDEGGELEQPRTLNVGHAAKTAGQEYIPSAENVFPPSVTSPPTVQSQCYSLSLINGDHRPRRMLMDETSPLTSAPDAILYRVASPLSG